MDTESEPLVPTTNNPAEPMVKGSTSSVSGSQSVDQLLHIPATASNHKKNLIVLSLAFLFNFTAYSALQNLQSSLHATAGVASLAVIYGGIIISSLFAPALIRAIGTKWAIAVCIFCYTLFTIANYYPREYTLIPAGLILGLAGAPLWISQGTYLTTTAISYADIKNKVPENVINQFNGIFFFFFQGSQITGNLVASLVLYPSSNMSTFNNVSLCGKHSCGFSNESDDEYNGSHIVHGTIVTLISVYLACGLLSCLLVGLFLSKLHAANAGIIQSLQSNILATLRLLLNPYILMLLPLFIYSGMEQAFVFGDFTKAFITCTNGIHYVGFVMMVFGISDAICSFLLGRLEKYSGRITIFTAGGLTHMTIILMLMFVWTPESNGPQLWDRFVLAAFWGFGDAVWQTQISSILGVIFPENQEPAFSNFRLFQAVGFCIYFGLSTAAIICVSHKLITIAAVLFIGLLLYYTVEWKIRQAILY
ncbi:protein unc-93 homolog A-like isoform X2 [Acanthaster planci]|nr:protein unc-93 homolog A-like isoform X2 [Acanthaster planci]XP_022096278.1 protein unc-93 homolog A-like isoform X2 [Acanthaster planci]XP_022096279.1 protein unc-93 homolog A-like isoform X2 [Acanthaster planci]XP_022096280.1 protein unc-93 homolog A-like isoform X2 [Acanthaster planci]